MYKDIKGMKFGRLTVLEYVGTKNNRAMWLCKCDCGNTKIVSGINLRRGTTSSCGCLRKEVYNDSRFIKKVSENILDYNNSFDSLNRYDLSGDYGIGYTVRTNNPFLFDKEDFEKIKGYLWTTSRNGYVFTRNYPNKKTLYLHRFILGLIDFDTYCVDHINHNPNDNRKDNLRIATNSQNQMNKCMMKSNTSGFTGIVWNKGAKKWLSNISINGKYIHLGLFDEITDAIKVRKDAEKYYFGEYAYSL